MSIHRLIARFKLDSMILMNLKLWQIIAYQDKKRNWSLNVGEGNCVCYKTCIHIITEARYENTDSDLSTCKISLPKYPLQDYIETRSIQDTVKEEPFEFIEGYIGSSIALFLIIGGQPFATWFIWIGKSTFNERSRARLSQKLSLPIGEYRVEPLKKA